MYKLPGNAASQGAGWPTQIRIHQEKSKTEEVHHELLPRRILSIPWMDSIKGAGLDRERSSNSTVSIRGKVASCGPHCSRVRHRAQSPVISFTG